MDGAETIARSWRGVTAPGMLPFAAIWNAIVLGIVTSVLRKLVGDGAGPPCCLLVVLVPFVWAGWHSARVGLMYALDRTRLTLDGGGLHAAHGPIPHGGPSGESVAPIVSVGVTGQPAGHNALDAWHAGGWAVVVRGGGGSVRLHHGLHTEAQARHLAGRIAAHAGVAVGPAA